MGSELMVPLIVRPSLPAPASTVRLPGLAVLTPGQRLPSCAVGGAGPGGGTVKAAEPEVPANVRLPAPALRFTVPIPGRATVPSPPPEMLAVPLPRLAVTAVPLP